MTAVVDSERTRARRGSSRPLARVAIGLLVALFAAWAFIAEPFMIPSESMQPTLRPGDRVLVLKPPLLRGDLERDQLVVFHAPDTGQIEIKRIVGVPGDRVALEDGLLVVNGARVRETSVDSSLADTEYFGPVTVPARSVFVMGDNRGDSLDSREFGAVPDRDVIGRVVTRFWPLSR